MVNKPVVRHGEIVIRPLMALNLTSDHRIIDGIPAGIFMGTVMQLMMRPYLLLL